MSEIHFNANEHPNIAKLFNEWADCAFRATLDESRIKFYMPMTWFVHDCMLQGQTSWHPRAILELFKQVNDSSETKLSHDDAVYLGVLLNGIKVSTNFDLEKMVSDVPDSTQSTLFEWNTIQHYSRYNIWAAQELESRISCARLKCHFSKRSEPLTKLGYCCLHGHRSQFALPHRTILEQFQQMYTTLPGAETVDELRDGKMKETLVRTYCSECGGMEFYGSCDHQTYMYAMMLAPYGIIRPEILERLKKSFAMLKDFTRRGANASETPGCLALKRSGFRNTIDPSNAPEKYPIEFEKTPYEILFGPGEGNWDVTKSR